MPITSVLRTLTLTLALAPLGLSAVPASGSDSHGIVGGGIITDVSSFEYKHTVRLLNGAVTEGEDLPQNLRGIRLSWRCSAAVVSKNALVSAAHCFPKMIGLKDPQSGRVYRASLKDLKVEAFFKTDSRVDRMTGIRAQKILVHPEYRDDWTARVGDVWNPTESIHDLALVRLQEVVPADKAAVSLLGNTDAPLQEGEELVLAGYGRDLSDDQISLPRLRSVSVPLREQLRNKTEWFAGSGDTTKAGRVERPAGGCMGDSGGPAFVMRANKAKLVGVIVRGPDDANGGCAAAVTILTSLPHYSAWLAAGLKELN